MGSDASFVIPGIPDDAALMCLALLPRGCYGVLKCVSRRWKAALEDEHVYSLREQLGRKESWVYVNVYHHPPPSATTTSSTSSHSSSFRGGKPPSQIRVDSLYAFSPILNRWFRLSEIVSFLGSRRIKTVAVKHKQYVLGNDLVIRDAVTGACTRGPQLLSGAHLGVQLAASDSHVVAVSASPQAVFGDSDSPGDVFAHVLAVDEAGRPHGEWQRLPPRRWTGLVSLLAHEGGLWHLIGPQSQGWHGNGSVGGRGGERMRHRWDRQMASFDPYALQWIEADEEEEEDFDPLFEAGMMQGGRNADAALDGGDSGSNSRGVVEVDCGEGPRGCHKQLLLQAAAACEALRDLQQTSMQDLLVLQGEDLQLEMRHLLTRGPQPLAVDDQGQQRGREKGGKDNLKVGLLVNEENVVRVMASGGTGIFSITRDMLIIIPVAAGDGYMSGFAGGEELAAGVRIGAAGACDGSERKKGSMLCLLQEGGPMVVWENGLDAVYETELPWGEHIAGGAFVMSM